MFRTEYSHRRAHTQSHTIDPTESTKGKVFFSSLQHAKPKTIKIPCNKVFSPLIGPNKPQENNDNTNNDSQFTHS